MSKALVGLSKDIEDSIKIVLKGLTYDVDVVEIDPDKMSRAMKSKETSFLEVKKLLGEWVGSPNRPSDSKILKYAKDLVDAGDTSISKLRKALRVSIDYSELPAEKHGAATQSKTIILKSIRTINSSLSELRLQISEDKVKFTEQNFNIGYPERFARGDFYPTSNYHKSWIDEENNAIKICPKSSEGKMITIDDLNIILPKEPARSRIKYNKLKKKDQYWKREEIPEGLNPDTVDNFSEYILEQFRLRREGMWFMNNGEPTYLTGAFWFALQWGKMLDNGGYMLFKEAQWEMATHMEACVVDKRCLGQLFVKSRRTGFTYLVILSRLLNRATGMQNGRLGMTSKSDKDVKEVFKKFSYAFLELPFFFQPVVKGKQESLSNLFFGKPADTTKEAKLAKNTSTRDYLNTEIDTRSTTNDAYDSTKLDEYLGDEASKWRKPNNYIEHFGTIKPAMMPSGRVIGKAWIGSTVGAAKAGGANYKILDQMSDPNERSELTGTTASGLYSYFLPAHKNQEICTDIHGKCWQHKPPTGTLDNHGMEIRFGSIDFLKDEARKAREKSDAALNAFYRAEPMTREHAYRDKIDACQFDLNKLYEQEDYNSFQEQEDLYVTGNFMWKGGIKDTEVIFTATPKGRFKIAWMPSVVDGTEGLRNNTIKKNDKIYPLNDYALLSSDPFSVRATVGGKGSSGAIHGFCKEAVGRLQKNDCFLQYLCRPKTEDIFFEDFVMAMHFYGIQSLPELNRAEMVRYCRDRGYRPFIMNRIDRPTNKLSDHEIEFGGQQMSGVDILDKHLTAINNYITNFVGFASKNNPYRIEGEMGRFPFNETIQDWKIFDPAKRTKHDASVSSGIGIMAINKDRYKRKKIEMEAVDISTIFPMYKIKR